ncbi:MAG: XRE family transcriptional regulator [Pseudomonas farsensis]|uniref:helix-turn-helix domain-containing protein n=1 Tax=Pseudomonas farsensis TaxID=2745492 RepID=UPI003C7B48C0
MSQNLFALFTDDPVESSMEHLKTQLFVCIIGLIRRKNLTQAAAAQELSISAPRMSNLFKGHLEKFSVDMLLEMSIKLGCKLDVEVGRSEGEDVLCMSLSKSVA